MKKSDLDAAVRDGFRRTERRRPGAVPSFARRAGAPDPVLRALLFCSALVLPAAAFGQPAGELVITPTTHKSAAPPAARVKGKGTPEGGKDPKLVVLIVADQLRADTLKRYRSLLSGDGLLRLSRGATAVGHYGQQNTYTGPGHALIATGSYGYLNGITQNKWFNRATGRSEAMMFDPGAKVLGDKDGGAEEETSPRNLVGTTLFDELRLGNPAAKVVAIALKGRGSLLLGGQTGTAYFFSDQSGSFTTTSYYAAEPPAWVKAWNGRKLADAAAPLYATLDEGQKRRLGALVARPHLVRGAAVRAAVVSAAGRRLEGRPAVQADQEAERVAGDADGRHAADHSSIAGPSGPSAASLRVPPGVSTTTCCGPHQSRLSRSRAASSL